MLQIKKFQSATGGGDFDRQGFTRFSYLLQEGKTKSSETSHRMGNKFPTHLWGPSSPGRAALTANQPWGRFLSIEGRRGNTPLSNVNGSWRV